MRKVIFDCDTGTDDAVALMLLVLSKKFDIQGVSCVWGNQPVEATSKNTLSVLDFMNSNIKVYKGCDKPLNPEIQKLRKEVVTEGPIYYFDEQGKQHHLHPNKLWIPETKRTVEEKHAVDFIIETCLNSKEKITIIPVGPCTNIGAAIKKDPRIVEHIEEIVFMGGSVNTGNVTEYAEANFFNDPDAIKTILDSNVKCVMAALNATTACALSMDDADTLIARDSKYSKFAGEIIKWRADVEKHLGWTDGKKEAVHDPLAVCYLIDESIVKEMKECQTDIDISTNKTAGKLIVDEGVGNKNVKIMMSVDPKDYLNMWIKYLG